MDDLFQCPHCGATIVRDKAGLYSNQFKCFSCGGDISFNKYGKPKKGMSYYMKQPLYITDILTVGVPLLVILVIYVITEYL